MTDEEKDQLYEAMSDARFGRNMAEVHGFEIRVRDDLIRRLLRANVIQDETIKSLKREAERVRAAISNCHHVLNSRTSVKQAHMIGPQPDGDPARTLLVRIEEAARMLRRRAHDKRKEAEQYPAVEVVRRGMKEDK